MYACSGTRARMPDQHATIDQFFLIFKLTMGSLKGAFGMLLWCWVQTNTPLEFGNQSVYTYIFLFWAVLVLLYKLFNKANKILANEFGREKFCFNLNDEVVVSGASNGLGLLLSAIFSTKGLKVHMLDIEKPKLNIANSEFHKCDVSIFSEVEKTLRNINPKLVVNCAGVLANSLGDISTTTPNSIEHVLDVNCKGTMFLTKVGILQGAQYVVGISSSTALCGPAYASVYAASKSAVRTFFQSLYYELFPTVRVLCFNLGQLDTRMFGMVKTPSNFFSPVLNSADVAQLIVDAIERGEQGEISVPLYAEMLPYIMLLPRSVLGFLRAFVGVDMAASEANERTNERTYERSEYVSE